MAAQIISVVDAYAAMISHRPYRKPLSHSQAMAEVMWCRGRQFAPTVAQVFAELVVYNQVEPKVVG